MPVVQIAAELAEGLALLEGSDGAKKHQSLRAIFEHSWTKLSNGEQQLLLSLSVFQGGFTRASATAVTGASLPPLLSLLDAAFLNISEQGRYTQHPLLAHFVREKAVQNLAEQEKVQLQFIRYYSQMAWQARQNYYGKQQLQWVIWSQDEYANLEAAFELAAAHHLLIDALQLGVFQSLGWQRRGLLKQGAARLEPLLRLAEVAHLQREASYRWASQTYCYLSLYSGGWTPGVAEQLSKTIELAREAQDVACLAQCRSVEGVFLAVTNQLHEAKRVFSEVADMALAAGAHYEAGTAFGNLVSVCNNLGAGDEVMNYLARGLSHVRQHQLRSIEGSLLLLKAEQITGQGRFNEALELLNEAESIFKSHQMVKDLAFVHKLRGLARFFGCQYGDEDLGNKVAMINADWQEANRLMAGNAVNRNMDLLVPQAGDLLLLQGNLDASEEFFRSGLSEALQQEVKPLIINNNLGLGRTLFARGHYEEALPHLLASLEGTETMTVWCIAAEVAAACLARLGKENDALKLWGKTHQEREDMKALRFPVYAGYFEPEIQKVKQKVSSEEVQRLMKLGAEFGREEIVKLVSNHLK